MKPENPPKEDRSKAEAILSFEKYWSLIAILMLVAGVGSGLIPMALKMNGWIVVGSVFFAMVLLAFAATASLWFPKILQDLAEPFLKPHLLGGVEQEFTFKNLGGHPFELTIDYRLPPHSQYRLDSVRLDIETYLNRHFQTRASYVDEHYRALEEALDPVIADAMDRQPAVPVWTFRIRRMHTYDALPPSHDVPIGDSDF